MKIRVVTLSFLFGSDRNKLQKGTVNTCLFQQHSAVCIHEHCHQLVLLFGGGGALVVHLPLLLMDYYEITQIFD